MTPGSGRRYGVLRDREPLVAETSRSSGRNSLDSTYRSEHSFLRTEFTLRESARNASLNVSNVLLGQSHFVRSSSASWLMNKGQSALACAAALREEGISSNPCIHDDSSMTRWSWFNTNGLPPPQDTVTPAKRAARTSGSAAHDWRRFPAQPSPRLTSATLRPSLNARWNRTLLRTARWFRLLGNKNPHRLLKNAHRPRCWRVATGVSPHPSPPKN